MLHHNRKILVFRTVGEECIQFNKMSRSDVEESIKFVLTKTLGISPKIQNFSQPRWSQLDSYLGCYTNAAVKEDMTGPEFYAELIRFFNSHTNGVRQLNNSKFQLYKTWILFRW